MHHALNIQILQLDKHAKAGHAGNHAGKVFAHMLQQIFAL